MYYVNRRVGQFDSWDRLFSGNKSAKQFVPDILIVSPLQSFRAEKIQSYLACYSDAVLAPMGALRGDHMAGRCLGINK